MSDPATIAEVSLTWLDSILQQRKKRVWGIAIEQFVTQSAYQSQYRIESLGTWTGKFKISFWVETEQGRIHEKLCGGHNCSPRLKLYHAYEKVFNRSLGL